MPASWSHPHSTHLLPNCSPKTVETAKVTLSLLVFVPLVQSHHRSLPWQQRVILVWSILLIRCSHTVAIINFFSSSPYWVKRWFGKSLILCGSLDRVFDTCKVKFEAWLWSVCSQSDPDVDWLVIGAAEWGFWYSCLANWVGVSYWT